LASTSVGGTTAGRSPAELYAPSWPLVVVQEWKGRRKKASSTPLEKKGGEVSAPIAKRKKEKSGGAFLGGRRKRSRGEKRTYVRRTKRGFRDRIRGEYLLTRPAVFNGKHKTLRR